MRPPAVPSRSSGSEKLPDSFSGFSVRRPVTLVEHSSSDSPQKPADLSGSPTYSQRVKEMSDRETDYEVRWQEWRTEENATKVS